MAKKKIKKQKQTTSQWRQLTLKVVPVIFILALLTAKSVESEKIALIIIITVLILGSLALVVTTPWIFVAVVSMFVTLIIVPTIVLGYLLLGLENIRGTALDPKDTSDALIFFALAAVVYFIGWKCMRVTMVYFARKQR